MSIRDVSYRPACESFCYEELTHLEEFLGRPLSECEAARLIHSEYDDLLISRGVAVY